MSQRPPGVLHWPSWAVVGVIMTSPANLIVTVITIVLAQIWYHFYHFSSEGVFWWLVLILSSCNHSCLSYPTVVTLFFFFFFTVVTLTPLIRAIVGVIPVSEYIHFNCTLKITNPSLALSFHRVYCGTKFRLLNISLDGQTTYFSVVPRHWT